MCIFCNIIQQNEHSKYVYQDEQLIVIKDLYPKALHHYLILPIKHIENLGCASSQEELNTISYLFAKIPHIADHLNLEQFKIISNSGADAGQEVFHLHVHLLSGPSVKAML